MQQQVVGGGGPLVMSGGVGLSPQEKNAGGLLSIEVGLSINGIGGMVSIA